MRIKENHWLLSKPIAHRGLWGNGVIENSTTAYENAAKLGYPIEIDLYKTTDGEIVSFHDDWLERLTGEKGYIYEKSYSFLKGLRLSGSSEKIPTLSEVLEIARDKSPLLIELKDQPDASYVSKVVDILKGFKGDFALQSFNPFYIKTVKHEAPDFIRGILADRFCAHKKPMNRWIVRKMPLNFIIKPDFISYNFSGLPVPKHKAKDKAVIAWTVTDKATAEKIKPYCNNIIFEHFIPKEYK